jgi:hypothetical protein
MVSKTDKQNSENKQSYLIGFYFNEARLLKQFLSYALDSVFECQRIETIKKLKNSKKEDNDENQNDAKTDNDGELW